MRCARACGPDGNSEDEKVRALPPGELSALVEERLVRRLLQLPKRAEHFRDMGPDGNGAAPPRRPTSTADKCGKRWRSARVAYGEFLSTPAIRRKNARVPSGVQRAVPGVSGDIIEVRPKGGKTFYGCSRYSDRDREVRLQAWQKPIPEPCPACGEVLVIVYST